MLELTENKPRRVESTENSWVLCDVVDSSSAEQQEPDESDRGEGETEFCNSKALGAEQDDEESLQVVRLGMFPGNEV